MRIGMSLPGPFWVSWQVGGRYSRRHLRHSYAGTLPGWQCLHDHKTKRRARRCARREERRRSR